MNTEEMIEALNDSDVHPDMASLDESIKNLECVEETSDFTAELQAAIEHAESLLKNLRQLASEVAS